MPDVSRLLLVIAQTFAVAAGATWLVRRLARRRGWLAPPRPDRWHREPTALHGGAGIFAGFAAGLLWFVPGSPFSSALLALTAVMFVTGLLDDLLDIRPQTKVLLQIIGGLLLYASGFHFNDTFAWWLDLALVVCWVVAITNAMNLLDNMNGLAAGTAVIAGVSRLMLYGLTGDVDGALASAVFVGAVLGFLVFNFPRASIFMGDSGSFTIGFALAALNLTGGQAYSKSLFSIFVFPVLVLALPIFDTAFVSVVRYFDGRAISQGGRDHTSHRLVAIGLSETTAVVMLWAVSAAAGALAFVLYSVGFSYALFALGLLLMTLTLFGVALARIRVYPEGSEPASLTGFVLPGELRYKRQILWVLFDGVTALLAIGLAARLVLPSPPEAGSGWDWQPPSDLPVAAAAVMLGWVASGLYRSDWVALTPAVFLRVAAGTVAGLLATRLARMAGVLGPPWPWPAVALAAVLLAAGVSATRLAVRALDRRLHDPGGPRG